MLVAHGGRAWSETGGAYYLGTCSVGRYGQEPGSGCGPHASQHTTLLLDGCSTTSYKTILTHHCSLTITTGATSRRIETEESTAREGKGRNCFIDMSDAWVLFYQRAAWTDYGTKSSNVATQCLQMSMRTLNKQNKRINRIQRLSRWICPNGRHDAPVCQVAGVCAAHSNIIIIVFIFVYIRPPYLYVESVQGYFSNSGSGIHYEPVILPA
ncbi:hypothetical protein EVAR_43897_1 [Eumeta japonica]|uniref:Uncharacterized protein n=1 Tax=Eumeta variegata TaxID=151549 RepID=A0A4C1WML4_EUMVA|nr:hypothetical protein EVAR_43897_1 [Eumeta japonica]